METYSTAQIARRIGVDKKTLLRWLYSKRLAEPEMISVGWSNIRVWSESDLTRANRFKQQNYCKGRGRKKA